MINETQDSELDQFDLLKQIVIPMSFADRIFLESQDRVGCSALLSHYLYLISQQYAKDRWKIYKLRSFQCDVTIEEISGAFPDAFSGEPERILKINLELEKLGILKFGKLMDKNNERVVGYHIQLHDRFLKGVQRGSILFRCLKTLHLSKMLRERG